MEAHFIVLVENKKPKKFKLRNNEFVILGRDTNKCQVPLSDDTSSSKHCKISIIDHEVFVEDLDSKNGVFLNGVRVLKQRFYINDKIKFGKTTIYLNPKRMDQESIKVCTYGDGTKQRNLNDFTFELAASIKPGASEYDFYSNKAQKNVGRGNRYSSNLSLQGEKRTSQKDQQSANRQRSISNAKPISRAKLNFLKNIANLIDITITLFCFKLIIETFRLFSSHLDEIASRTGLIKFLFHSDMIAYTAGIVIVCILIYRTLRRLTDGSPGQRITNITAYKG